MKKNNILNFTPKKEDLQPVNMRLHPESMTRVEKIKSYVNSENGASTIGTALYATELIIDNIEAGNKIIVHKGKWWQWWIKNEYFIIKK